ncbi:CaiB/BaiF CoA transferase family protein [Haladaptatus sp. GCM10025707]|uniref:CaiB/BaiF CoA transferase family protein n=1 Tax=unclassified Haladaptatus TaxID=2622732 RepID=UPI0023E850C9|nr:MULTISPECIES: CaiB/BaiF CoA-transferase family protein [unclassified Haladaptatus]
MDLAGIRVLDLTRLLPGPYATQLLSDLGADVIKVEDTNTGDYARSMPPLTDEGVGAVFDGVNRGKRSVAIDLKAERGQDAFYELVANADVVFESFRPGVTDRLGIDYDTLTEHNPDLVYCSLSGFGQSGPLADTVGHDLNYVALSGLLDMTRADENSPPQIPGYPTADMAGGLFAAFSIVSALLSRELGNGGGYVDVAMTDVVLSFSHALAAPAFDGETPRPGQTPLTGAYPWYDVYAAKDGYVTIAALEPKFWRAFCEAVGRTDLISVHMTDDEAEREALRQELENLFAGKTRDEWESTLEGVEAAFCGVYTVSEALSHPQLQSRDVIRRPESGRPRIGFPAVTDRDVDTDESLPEQGEHTAVVLREIGFSAFEIDKLHEEGVID